MFLFYKYCYSVTAYILTFLVLFAECSKGAGRYVRVMCFGASLPFYMDRRDFWDS
jgi:hypothetical protein